MSFPTPPRGEVTERVVFENSPDSIAFAQIDLVLQQLIGVAVFAAFKILVAFSVGCVSLFLAIVRSGHPETGGVT